MAMQAMDDAALSATTGQDGISIGIGISKVDIAKVHIFDGDGLAPGTLTAGQPGFGGTAKTGAITLNNVVVICAELAGDFHLGYARQLTDKSSLLFDLAF